MMMPSTPDLIPHFTTPQSSPPSSPPSPSSPSPPSSSPSSPSPSSPPSPSSSLSNVSSSNSRLIIFKNIYISPISTVTPSIYKPVNVLMAFNGILAILAGIDLTTIFICNFYLSSFGISLFGPFYFFHWMSICAIATVFAFSFADIAKLFSIIPYLSITIYRLVSSCFLANEFNQNPQNIFIQLGISEANIQICGAIGFFILSNLLITVIHGYFALAGFCYFFEEILLNVLQKKKAGNIQSPLSQV